ncbi:protein MIZU-KUSSEI 1 [Diospyros lotus]|uniref:protein MIZU-KUSSEI 1 n=1 Tax=Diospyros lotus TaxID=55363 RepID=UPI00224CBF79|nr:protein MIZU-KUSSEI 1 [Diospyros lotus]
MPATKPEPPADDQPPPTHKKNRPTARLLRRFRSVFRSFPVINPPCRMVAIGNHHHPHDSLIHGGGTKMTGTLFGSRKSRVNLVIQEKPRSLPILILELSIQTGKLLQDMGMGLVRIALECEKEAAASSKAKPLKLMEEPIWSMYCNGRKTGYAVRREPTDDDMGVMQLLNAVSMGAGVLPAAAGGELTYMRAYFERVVGSKDSETYYMMNPEGNSGPELSIFFVRI